MYAVIECIERQIYFTPAGETKDAANKKLRELFLEANRDYLSKDDIKILESGGYPSFEEDTAEIKEGIAWSNLDSSRNYDAVVSDLERYSRVISFEDALEVVKKAAPFKDYQAFKEDLEPGEYECDKLWSLCGLRNTIYQMLSKIDAGEGLNSEDIGILRGYYMGIDDMYSSSF